VGVVLAAIAVWVALLATFVMIDYETHHRYAPAPHTVNQSLSPEQLKGIADIVAASHKGTAEVMAASHQNPAASDHLRIRRANFRNHRMDARSHGQKPIRGYALSVQRPTPSRTRRSYCARRRPVCRLESKTHSTASRRQVLRTISKAPEKGKYE